MGKITGFMEYDREGLPVRPIEERLQDFDDVYNPLSEEKLRIQAARCMDCGVPFCHSACPLNNLCPEWNDLVYRGEWQMAADRLLSTNFFPEFTGRVCPALCEASCVLGIHSAPMTNQIVERNIIEKAFEKGYIKPFVPAVRTGKKVAVVGSGPSGLAAAEQLNRSGHTVTVYEKLEKTGGLLRYGIPNFKLEKQIIDRRVDLMKAEGIVFICNTDPDEKMLAEYDAVVIAIGAGKPRDLPIPGRELNGIHFALDFLGRQNRLLGKEIDGSEKWGRIDAKDKHVIVIGGGDTGSDCIGTALRQGAKSVQSFELMAMPPESRSEKTPWPFWPFQLRTSTSHKEGGSRFWNIRTKEFEGFDGQLKRLVTENAEDGSARTEWPADLILLALGFLGPEQDGIIRRLGLETDDRSNIRTKDFQTSRPGVFAAGDTRRGQSLVVWAIREGKDAAVAVDKWLKIS